MSEVKSCATFNGHELKDIPVVEKYGHNISVPDDDLADYDAETCNYGPSGQVIDLDHLMIHGTEGAETPFPCRYFGAGLPASGVKPAKFCHGD